MFFSSKEETKTSTRQDRKKCWDARDEYFACLDKKGVIKPGEEKADCSKEARKYEGSCAKSWIDYFNQRRVIEDAQRARLAQAATQAQNTKK